jgi:hypothetical protein
MLCEFLSKSLLFPDSDRGRENYDTIVGACQEALFAQGAKEGSGARVPTLKRDSRLGIQRVPRHSPLARGVLGAFGLVGAS